MRAAADRGCPEEAAVNWCNAEVRLYISLVGTTTSHGIFSRVAALTAYGCENKS